MTFFDFRQSLAATANSLCLSKSLRQRMWDDSQQTVRQLPDIGRLLAQRLASAGLGGLRQLAEADPRRIEAVTQKAYPFGNTLRGHLAKLLPPEVQLRLTLLTGPHPRHHNANDLQLHHPSHSGSHATVEVELTRLAAAGGGIGGCGDGGGSGSGSCSSRNPAHLLVGLSNSDRLLRHERLIVEAFPSPYKFQVAVSPPPQTPRNEPLHVLACLIMERTCGLDVHASLRLAITTHDEGALQPSPFPLRTGGPYHGEGGGNFEEDRAALEKVGELAASARLAAEVGSGRGAARTGGSLKELSSQRSQRRYRELGCGEGSSLGGAGQSGSGGGGGEGRFVTRMPQVMMEAPALAAPVFALAAADGPANGPSKTTPTHLYHQPPLHQHQHQQQQCRPSSSAALSQPLSGTTSDTFPRRGCSAAATAAATAKAAPKRASGGGRGGGGGRQAQGLTMSGTSLSGAKQVPAFARLLALASKPTPTPTATPTPMSATAAAEASAGPAMVAAAESDGTADWLLADFAMEDADDESFRAAGGVGVPYGTYDFPSGGCGNKGALGGGGCGDMGPVRDSAGNTVRQGEAGGPLDDVFGFLGGQGGVGRSGRTTVARVAVATASAQAGAAEHEQPEEDGTAVPTRRQLAACGGFGDAVLAPPPPAARPPAATPIQAAAPSAAAAAAATPPLASQVLRLHRPGMSSRQLSIAGAPQEPAASTLSPSASAGAPQRQPRQQGPATAGAGGSGSGGGGGGSHAAVLTEHKRRMLLGSRDRDITEGLQLMQQRRARNANGFNGGSTSGFVVNGQRSGGDDGGRLAVGQGTAAAAAVGISSPTSSSTSVMRVGGSAAAPNNLASAPMATAAAAVAAAAVGPEDDEGEYDPAAVVASAAGAIWTSAEDGPGAMRLNGGVGDGWTRDGGDGGAAFLGHDRYGRPGGMAASQRQGLGARCGETTSHRSCSAAGAPTGGPAGGWSEFVDESDANVSQHRQPAAHQGGGGTWRAAKALRATYGTSAPATCSYMEGNGGGDGGGSNLSSGPGLVAVIGQAGTSYGRDSNPDRVVQPPGPQALDNTEAPQRRQLTTNNPGVIAAPSSHRVAAATAEAAGWQSSDPWDMSPVGRKALDSAAAVAAAAAAAIDGQNAAGIPSTYDDTAAPAAGGEDNNSVAAAAPVYGTTGGGGDGGGGGGGPQASVSAANRYFALARLSQGLRKRKAQPLSDAARSGPLRTPTLPPSGTTSGSNNRRRPSAAEALLIKLRHVRVTTSASRQQRPAPLMPHLRADRAQA
ncbi:hypothetical protein VOLCADRAFT_97115 [Volvox carteri f. nagariensis]|uniref:SEC63 domain-containing protein n=1 Tax=Volvox carteri f. nagariensis TaxID=3068 RepID=D8UBX7_VOLCA|nr:uncharacterized protein VOLCADRAFT_97115 [Volvox carteri f. nagariensis]EFJ42750.1 hypothetical protein VOLCADRAFT_97115 [Volvox carteri f. nagariensis]|eukprot:XP_002956211.1 hypothetical protein VOLCADRAFT_97115 [Volvox carteri f. nagariensis]